MTSLKIRSISLIFILCICLNFHLKSQMVVDQDSVADNHYQINNIGYGSESAWMISSSISTVRGSKLEKIFSSKLSNTLYGRLPGLTVVQGSGEPGGDSPSIYARGVNTFGSGKDLLIIVDGFESSFEQLVPYEVESVSLLKDASATAIYGSRGANGVLLVTTKRGIMGQMKVNFSTQVGFESALHLPEFLGSYDYARLYNEGLINDGKTALYSDADITSYQNEDDPFFHPDVNWHDELLRKSAPVANYNLSFRGGDEGVKYFVLINILNRQGLFKKSEDLSDFTLNSKYTKYNLRTNFDINLTKRLAAVISLGGSIDNKDMPSGNATNSLFNLMASVPPNAFPVINPNKTYGGNALYANPLGNVLETGLYTSSGRTFQINLKLTQQLDMITKGLSLSGAASFNDYSSGYNNRTRQYPRYSISKDASENTIYTKFGQSTSLGGGTGVLNQWRNYSLKAFLNYNRIFDKHLIDAIVMTSMDNNSMMGVELSNKYNSIGGRFTYAYSEKYIGELSFGYMGSENYPEGNRYGLFPALSVGWVVSNESFLKGSSLVDYLKLRGSYGQTGNTDIGGQRFMFQQFYPSTASYYFGTSNTAMSGYAEGSIANPNVTWEKENKKNIGIEMTVLDKIMLTIDLFSQDRFDILAIPYSTTPQLFGMVLPNQNVGKVSNKGFEAMFRYETNTSKRLQLFVETNVWYARNKIIFNAESVKAYDYLNRTGQAVNQPFMLQAIGFFSDTEDIASSPNQPFSVIKPGDIKYRDQNGDNVIDQNDNVPIGNTTVPKLTLGFTTGLYYKGFDLELFVQGVTGRTVYLSGNYFQAFQNNGKVSSFALGRWTPETATTATYPRLTASNNLNNFQTSSFWQRDGSFIKLRSVEIGYNLSKRITDVIKLESARFFLNGSNLLSFDHMDFTDPETITGYPATRTYSVGVRIQF